MQAPHRVPPAPMAVLSTQDFSMRVDLSRKLQFPSKITSTSLHPDIVMWSSNSKTVLFIELTIPWEAGIEAASGRKRLKYADLAAECREAGWRTMLYPVEVGCCGFAGTATVHLLRDLGVTGAGQRKALKDIAEMLLLCSSQPQKRLRGAAFGSG